MKARLLSEETFQALLSTHSYQEFLDLLHGTAYQEVLFQDEGTDISVQMFTQRLYGDLFHDYYKVIRSFSGALQEFFILFYQKYELINLKTLLKGIFGKEPPETIKPLLLPTERHLLFSKDALLACKSVQEVIPLMQGSFFHYPLQQALRRFENEQEFFPLEMSLDLYYYHTLWDKLETLSGEERKTFQILLGILTDILNVSWIIRFKDQYHFSTEEILNYTIQHGHHFKLQERRQLAEARTLNDILAYLETTAYGSAISGNTSVNTLHVVLTRQLLLRLQQYFLGNPFHIGVIFAYLLLKEFEVSDLMAIAEARRYELPFEHTQVYVIHA